MKNTERTSRVSDLVGKRCTARLRYKPVDGDRNDDDDDGADDDLGGDEEDGEDEEDGGEVVGAAWECEFSVPGDSGRAAEEEEEEEGVGVGVVVV